MTAATSVGFTLEPGTNVIGLIMRGSDAQLNGVLEPGDEVLSVDGVRIDEHSVGSSASSALIYGIVGDICRIQVRKPNGSVVSASVRRKPLFESAPSETNGASIDFEMPEPRKLFSASAVDTTGRSLNENSNAFNNNNTSVSSSVGGWPQDFSRNSNRSVTSPQASVFSPTSVSDRGAPARTSPPSNPRPAPAPAPPSIATGDKEHDLRIAERNLALEENRLNELWGSVTALASTVAESTGARAAEIQGERMSELNLALKQQRLKVTEAELAVSRAQDALLQSRRAEIAAVSPPAPRLSASFNQQPNSESVDSSVLSSSSGYPEARSAVEVEFLQRKLASAEAALSKEKHLRQLEKQQQDPRIQQLTTALEQAQRSANEYRQRMAEHLEEDINRMGEINATAAAQRLYRDSQRLQDEIMNANLAKVVVGASNARAIATDDMTKRMEMLLAAEREENEAQVRRLEALLEERSRKLKTAEEHAANLDKELMLAQQEARLAHSIAYASRNAHLDTFQAPSSGPVVPEKRPSSPTLLAAISAAEDKAVEFGTEVGRLRVELEMSRSAASVADEERSRLRGRLSEFENRDTVDRNQLRELFRVLGSDSRLIEVEKAFSKAEQAADTVIARLQARLDQSADQNRRLRDQLLQQAARLDEVESLVSSAAMSADERVRSIREDVAREATRLARAEEDLALTAEEMQARMAHMEATLNERNARLAAADDAVDQLSMEREKLLQELELRDREREASVDESQLTTHQLRNQLQDLQAQLEDERARNSDLEMENAAVKEEVNNAVADAREALALAKQNDMERTSRHNEQISTLERSLRQLQSEIEAHRRRSPTSSGSAIAAATAAAMVGSNFPPQDPNEWDESARVSHLFGQLVGQAAGLDEAKRAIAAATQESERIIAELQEEVSLKADLLRTAEEKNMALMEENRNLRREINEAFAQREDALVRAQENRKLAESGHANRVRRLEEELIEERALRDEAEKRANNAEVALHSLSTGIDPSRSASPPRYQSQRSVSSGNRFEVRPLARSPSPTTAYTPDTSPPRRPSYVSEEPSPSAYPTMEEIQQARRQSLASVQEESTAAARRASLGINSLPPPMEMQPSPPVETRRSSLTPSEAARRASLAPTPTDSSPLRRPSAPGALDFPTDSTAARRASLAPSSDTSPTRRGSVMPQQTLDSNRRASLAPQQPSLDSPSRRSSFAPQFDPPPPDSSPPRRPSMATQQQDTASRRASLAPTQQDTSPTRRGSVMPQQSQETAAGRRASLAPQIDGIDSAAARRASLGLGPSPTANSSPPESSPPRRASVLPPSSTDPQAPARRASVLPPSMDQQQSSPPRRASVLPPGGSANPIGATPQPSTNSPPRRASLAVSSQESPRRASMTPSQQPTPIPTRNVSPVSFDRQPPSARRSSVAVTSGLQQPQPQQQKAFTLSPPKGPATILEDPRAMFESGPKPSRRASMAVSSSRSPYF